MVEVRHTSLGGTTADFVVTDTLDGWYRPEGMRFFPDKRDRAIETEPAEILKHIGEGWLPEKPFIHRDKLITALGSCFAFYVEDWLRQRGFQTSIGRYGDPGEDNYWSSSLLIKCGDGFVNTYSILYQFEWLFEDKRPDIAVWLKADGAVQRYVDDNAPAGKKLLNETEAFIITLGLSEVAYDKETQQVLWAGVPRSQYHPDRYGYRVTSVAENVENLKRIVGIIRKHKGDVPIIITLSPVPLRATFRAVSCITANSVSKATLRVAVDEMMRAREDDKNLYYWPSYEIVTGYLKDPMAPDDMHPNDRSVRAIMGAFFEAFCVP